MQTLEEVLSAKLGYEVDPVRMAMERARNSKTEIKTPPLRPLAEPRPRSGHDD